MSFTTAFIPCPSNDMVISDEIVVYGGTAGGVVASVAASRMGNNVTLINPSGHLGGMVSGGLGWTDGKPSGGIAAEFFKSVGGYHFTPGKAEAVFNSMVVNNSIRVIHNCYISTVEKKNGRIVSLTMTHGGRVTASLFLDATYEGDLMAKAGVEYVIGREANTTYNESAAGRLSIPPKWRCGCNWNLGDVNGTGPDGHPLPMVYACDPGVEGAGDTKVQAYNFRLCLTQDPRIRVPFPIPKEYDPTRWELLRRAVAVVKPSFHDFFIVNHLSDNKTDVNNGGGLSTDMVGASWGWPEANLTERERLFSLHKNYTIELFYFLSTDSEVPVSLRTEVSTWGLCGDEFVDTQHWPHQLYVREARRMVGDFIFTQHDRVTRLTKNDSIAVGDYNIDAHMIQRIITSDGMVTNEGCLSGWAKYAGIKLQKFDIPYRVLLPRRVDVTNLLVTAAISASHVGSASLRLEPQYMNMGHAAGVAAYLAFKNNTIVQDVSISKLQQLLIQQGVTLHATGLTGFICLLTRCVASPSSTANVTCAKQCTPLGKREWLGSTSAWILQNDGIAIAKKDTHLKKSTALSSTLPPSMVKVISKGDHCILNVTGNATSDNYFLCSMANGDSL